jgi:hypothetical protein
MVVNIVRLFHGFLNTNLSHEQSVAFFATVSEPTFVIKSCVFNAQTLLLDGVLVRKPVN